MQSSKKIQDLTQKRIYLNEKQVEFHAAMTNEIMLFGGRGVGKTTGMTSLFNHTCMAEMPRSLNLLGCKTYKSVLLNIIPGILKMYDLMEYVEEKDYWLCEPPPRAVPKSIYRIPEHDRALTMVNGSVTLFGSMDKGYYNSLSFDSGAFEEVRSYKKEKLEEILPAIRGNKDQPWANKWCHHAKLFITDKPKFAHERWIYDMFKGRQNDEVIRWILLVTRKIYELHDKLQSNVSASQGSKIRAQISSLESDLNELKKSSLLYFECSTFDNARILGLDSIKQLLASLPAREALRSVGNLDVMGDIRTLFYYLLSAEHQYEAISYSHFESGKVDKRNPEVDCRWDSDLKADEPIYVSCDWGQFNCLTAGQPKLAGGYRYLKAMHVELPLRTPDLAKEFCEYYRFHKTKEVHVPHDHTATGDDGKSFSYLTYFVTELERNGWTVYTHHIGAVPDPELRFNLWEILLSKKSEDGTPFIEFNASNCEDLLISMQGTRTKKVGDKIKKDKADEGKEGLNQAHTTHYGDGADTTVVHLFRYLLPNQQQGYFIPTNFGV